MRTEWPASSRAEADSAARVVCCESVHAGAPVLEPGLDSMNTFLDSHVVTEVVNADVIYAAAVRVPELGSKPLNQRNPRLQRVEVTRAGGRGYLENSDPQPVLIKVRPRSPLESCKLRVEKSEASLVQDGRGKDVNPLRSEAERFVFEIQAEVGIDCRVVPRLRVPCEAHKCPVLAAEVVIAANEPGVLSHWDGRASRFVKSSGSRC